MCVCVCVYTDVHTLPTHCHTSPHTHIYHTSPHTYLPHIATHTSPLTHLPHIATHTSAHTHLPHIATHITTHSFTTHCPDTSRNEHVHMHLGTCKGKKKKTFDYVPREKRKKYTPTPHIAHSHPSARKRPILQIIRSLELILRGKK
jgi:hypothetical protein